MMMSSEAQDKTTGSEQQLPTSNNNNTSATDHKRSSKDSINPITCPFTHTVKEAVAIAAGKKESDGDDDDGKNIRSNMLCYLYWLLVVLILGLISFTVWLSIQLARRHSEMNDHRKNFDFEDIFNETLKPKTFDVTWVRTDSYIYAMNGNLFLFNITSNHTKKIMDNFVTELKKPFSYSISKDLKYVLLQFDKKKVWRHSYLSKYAIHDTHLPPGVSRLHNLGDEQTSSKDKNKYLQNAQMAPTSSAMVFVSENNLFYKESPKMASKQITFSGINEEIFNGVSDWTYENILSKSSALWWSPNSRFICYLSINSSEVPKFSFMKYHGANATVHSFPHPKALPASHIPNVTVRVVDTDELKDENFLLVLQPPPEFSDTDHYVVGVSWIDDSKVLVVWHNRFHTQSISTLYDVLTGKFRNVNYHTISNGWINLSPQIIPVNSGSKYITVLQDSTTMWEHFVLVDAEFPESSESEKPEEATYLTQGLKDTPEIVGHNENGEIFYLLANGDPTTRHLFRLNWNTKTSKCMTCNMTECHYVSASFGHDSKYYILGCLGPHIPKYILKSVHTSLNVVLEDNKVLAQALSSKILPEVKFMSIRLGDNHNVTLQIHYPQEEGSKKFPLVIQSFGEPGETIATRKYELGWDTYLASKEEYVVAKVDLRGKGMSYKSHIYKRITQHDVDDLLTVGLHLKNNIDVVDPAKVAIWGWGFAGFLAMHALANETDVYPCGIVGGTLFDSDFYDAPTFERYMGSSEENHVGYLRSEITRKLDFLRNKKLAIIQGTADDNTRYASSLKVTKMLSNLDLPYKHQIYQDLDSYEFKAHRHAYHFMADFLKQDCFVYFWKHDTKTWVVDKTVKKDKFRIKQFCV